MPIAGFSKIFVVGYLSIIAEGPESYHLKLNQVINTIRITDLAYIAGDNTETAKLLGVIAESVPFKTNIGTLSGQLDLSKDSVYRYIYQWRDASLLYTLSSESKEVSTLQNPDKLFLENTNLAFTFKKKHLF